MTEAASVLVLRTAELRHNIFEFLHPRSLASVAVTCKTFSETALDVGWREVNDINRIVHVWSVRGVLRRDGFHGLKFRRSPERGDWERLLYYTRRIKRLSLDSSLGLGTLAELLRRGFSLPIPSTINLSENHIQTIFPLLKDLTWLSCFDSDARGCEAILRLAARPISRFKFAVAQFMQEVLERQVPAYIVAALKTHQRNLSTIVVHVGLGSSRDAFFELVEGAVGLNELAVPVSTLQSNRFIPIVARLPQLETLRLLYSPGHTVPAPSAPSPVDAFTHLAVLRVEGLAILDSINATIPTLKTLVVDGGWNETVGVQDAWTAMVTIGRRFSSSLEALYVRSPLDLLQQGHTPFVILPVLSCTRLRRLYVEFRTSTLRQSTSVASSPCDPLDEDWRRVAEELVELESLSFSCGPYIDQNRQFLVDGRLVRPRATLRSLLHLLHSPTLRHINVPLNISSADFAASGSVVVPLTSTRWLEFCRCWLDDGSIVPMALLLEDLQNVRYVLPRNRRGATLPYLTPVSNGEPARRSKWATMEGVLLSRLFVPGAGGSMDCLEAYVERVVFPRYE